MFPFLSKILPAGLATLLIVGCDHDAGTILAPDGAEDPDARWVIWQPPVLDQWTDITAGDFHTCGRRTNGAVYCWGLNNKGQVGGGSIVACSGNQSCVTRPSRIGQSILSAAHQVDAGADHTCALMNSGAAFCWGDGQMGQVAAQNGAYSHQYFSPTPVAGGVYDATWGRLWFPCANGQICVVRVGTADGEGREEHAVRFARLIHGRVRG